MIFNLTLVSFNNIFFLINYPEPPGITWSPMAHRCDTAEDFVNTTNVYYADISLSEPF